MDQRQFHRKRNTEALKKALADGLLVVNTDTGEIRNKSGKVLKQTIEYYGYPSVYMRVDGVAHKFYVHKVVWLAAGNELEKDKQLDHIDRNRANASIDNLRLLSPAENLARRQFKEKQELAF